MTTISDLSRDLVEEILSRAPLTSLRAVRTTCKTWNDISYNQILGKKAARKNQFLEFVVMDSRICLLKVDLRKDDLDLVDPSTKKISIPNHHQVEISHVYHCDGLLLCVIKDKEYSRLLVWNPYLGQTRLIQPRNIKGCTRLERYALGYDKNHNHKIVRFICGWENFIGDIYDFSSDSWRFLDVKPDWFDESSFVSLKGNTYFYSWGDDEVTTVDDGREVTNYLRCFDYTRERFGPPLHLPFHHELPSPSNYTTILSWVKDEKLAMLCTHENTSDIIEIWITTKIEPNAVSWSKFLTLTVDKRIINSLPDYFAGDIKVMYFVIDEENKVAVLFHDSSKPGLCKGWFQSRYQGACIVGEDGYFKYVNMREYMGIGWKSRKLVCSSYAPSLVQLQINKPEEAKEQINKPEEGKEQINQPGRRKERNQPGKRKKMNQPGKRKKRKQRGKMEKRNDGQSVPSLSFFFSFCFFLLPSLSLFYFS